jgi:hypothetical protein
MAILLNPETKEIHVLVGQAVDAYTHLEGAQAIMLEALLETPIRVAWIIYFSVQNSRGRLDMIGEILEAKHGTKYSKFWKECSKFLQKISQFRNALVHWQLGVSIYRDDEGGTLHAHELMHPLGLATHETIRPNDIPDFIKDCRYIEQEIGALGRELKKPAAALDQRFTSPNIRKNWP